MNPVTEEIELSHRSSVRFRSTGPTDTEMDELDITTRTYSRNSGYPETPTQLDHSMTTRTLADRSMDRYHEDYASSSTQPV